MEDLLHDKTILQILQRLGIDKRVDNKIQTDEALAVKLGNEDTVAVDYASCVWDLLRKIVLANSNALNECIEDKCRQDTMKSKLPKLNRKKTSSDAISSLDVFLAMYRFCDPLLQSLVARKLYLCKLAVPFIYNTLNHSTLIIDTWPLRSISLFQDNATAKSGNALTMETNIVTFVRVGRPKFSKSQCLNAVISGQSKAKQVFFDMECKRGKIPKVLSEGTTEIFWLPEEQENKLFNTSVTFLNVRGSLELIKNNTFLHLIQTISDCVVVVLDSKFVSQNFRKCITYLERFGSVVAILSGNTDFISEEKCEMLEKFHLCYTHEEDETKTMTDFLPQLTDKIKHCLNKETWSLLKRLENCTGVLNTENKPQLKNAKSEATKLFQLMKNEVINSPGEGMTWKSCFTPCSHIETKEIGKLLSEQERPSELEKIEEQHKKVFIHRGNQLSKITKIVQDFVKIIVSCEHSPMHIIHWLQSYIEDEIKPTLVSLKERKRQINEQLTDSTVTNAGKKILTRQIQALHDQIENCYFGTEYLLREVGHICDSSIELGTDTTSIGLPPLDAIASVVADLIIAGMSFELVDGHGDYCFMPRKWIETVFHKLSNKLGGPRIAVVSVLGVQSSGKSTLLNSMFGLDMAVSHGRCTRGIHIRLLPITKTLAKDLPFSHFLIVDSEGLRAPELANEREKHNHDNQLATFVTGLGDITLINNMGESFSEMRDILEIVVHALVRLKLAGNALSNGQTCFFLHQNVPESANENMADVLAQLLLFLDRVTQESAKSEGIGLKNLKHFNDIIKFDALKNVFTIPNLWQGDPPMKTVSRSYTRKIHAIKESIFEALKNTCDKSFISLEDFSVRATDLWKGVLCENFVFSFRNSLEIKAYNSLERKLDKLYWSLEMFYLTEMNANLRQYFDKCTDSSQLIEAKRNVKDKMSEKLASKKAALISDMEEVFAKSEYKQIVINWQAGSIKKLDLRVSEINDTVAREAARCETETSLKIETQISKTERDEIRKLSIEVARSMGGKKNNQADIDDAFEKEIWQQSCKNILATHTEIKFDNLEKCFERHLREEFKNDFHLLKKELSQRHDCNKGNLEKLSGSSGILKIQNDLQMSLFEHNSSFPETIGLNEMIDIFLVKADSLVNNITNKDAVIQDIDVKHFVRLLQRPYKLLKNKLANCNISVTSGFNIKLYVHVCTFACPLFNKSNRTYREQHGVQNHLNEFRRILKKEFESAVNRCKAEEAFANQSFELLRAKVKERIISDIPTDILKVLKRQMPQLKGELIQKICEELGHVGDFNNYLNYMNDAKSYAKSWFDKNVENEVKTIMEYTEKVVELIDSKLEVLIKGVKTCTEKCNPCLSGIWLENLQNALPTTFIDYSSFDLLDKGIQLNNMNYFLDCLLKKGFERNQLTEEICGSMRQGKILNLIITYADENIFEYLWGCNETCPFCQEPCAKQNSHGDSNHICKQHRPTCCRGVRDKTTQKASITACNYNIRNNSDLLYNCAVINRKCGCLSEQWHPYIEYKQFNQTWDITPSSNMYDTAKFWLRFIGNYKHSLATHFSYKVDNVPSGWAEIGLEDAIKSLEKYW